MRRAFLSVVVLVLMGFIVSAQQAQDKGEGRKSVVAQSPQWEKLRSLVGEWEGTMDAGGQKLPATVEVRMTGDGSAMMHVMDKGGPYEMVTMIHPDGKRILATHYCAAHNQPRMALVPSKAPNQVAFDFVDGTNIAPGDGHMKGVVFTFVDADHHEEAWTHSGGGGAAIFKYARKK
jgi:hypothetical protein